MTIKTTKNIFTYGSLMFPAVWSRVVHGRYEWCSGHIRGYTRRRMRGKTYPGLIKKGDDSVVDGIVYMNVDDQDIKMVDTFEGQFYERVSDLVYTETSETIVCDFYLIRNEFLPTVNEEEWSPERFSPEGIFEFLKKLDF